jgi:hypothetical protein
MGVGVNVLQPDPGQEAVELVDAQKHAERPRPEDVEERQQEVQPDRAIDRRAPASACARAK